MNADLKLSPPVPDGHVLAEPHWDMPRMPEAQRIRRTRNKVLLIALTALVALFYAITIAKMGG